MFFIKSDFQYLNTYQPSKHFTTYGFPYWIWPSHDPWPTSVTVTSRLSPSPAASPPPLLLRIFSTTVLVICGISRHTSSASWRQICFSSTSVIPAIQIIHVPEVIVMQVIFTLPVLYCKKFPCFPKKFINVINICKTKEIIPILVGFIVTRFHTASKMI